MEKYVVSITRNNTRGLGVLSGDWILTCAHLCHGLSPDQSSHCELVIHREQEKFTAITVTVDLTLDFMVLGSETLAGTHCSSPDFWSHLDGLNSPVPVQLEYPERTFSATLKGFFFDPDGRTRIATDITIYRDSPFVSLSSKAEAGSSGSPIFTSENDLLGILTNAWGVEQTGCGILIEDAMSGWIRKQYSDLPILSITNNSRVVRSITEF